MGHRRLYTQQSDESLSEQPALVSRRGQARGGASTPASVVNRDLIVAV